MPSDYHWEARRRARVAERKAYKNFFEKHNKNSQNNSQKAPKNEQKVIDKFCIYFLRVHHEKQKFPRMRK